MNEATFDARMNTLEHKVDRMREVEKEQNALARMSEAEDQEFARRIVAKLIPERMEWPPELIWRKVPE